MYLSAIRQGSKRRLSRTNGLLAYPVKHYPPGVRGATFFVGSSHNGGCDGALGDNLSPWGAIIEPIGAATADPDLDPEMVCILHLSSVGSLKLALSLRW